MTTVTLDPQTYAPAAARDALAAAYSLSERIAVIIPTTVYNQPALPALIDKVKAYTLRKLAELAGGVTLTAGEGGYIANSGEYIAESVYIAESACNDALLLANDLVTLAQWIKTEMSQESVMIRINGTAYFI